MSEDNNGFLLCRVLDRKGGSRDISPDDISAVSKSDGLLWVHLDFETEGASEWLRNSSGLDETVVDAMLAADSRPRYFSGQDGSLVFLRGVNTNPGEDPEDMVSIRMWVEEDRIIATRRRRLLAVKEIVEALDKGRGPKSSGDFVAALVGLLADRIGAFVESIEDELDGCEAKLQAQDASGLGSRISNIRRQIAGVRRFLTPQRDALDKLSRFPASWISTDELQILREESDRVTRSLEDLDLARERAMVLREERDGQLAQQQNTRMYVLSVVAAIFLPLSFLTGLFGMNVGGLPGVDNPEGFLATMVLMGVSVVVLIVFFKLKDWF